MRQALVAITLSLLVVACSTRGGMPREDLPPPPKPSAYRADVGVKVAWKATVGKLPAQTGLALCPAVVGEQVFVANAEGRVAAFRVEDGTVSWQQDLQRPLSAGPSATDRLLVVGSRDGEAIGLDATDGELLWRSGVTSEILAAPALGAGLVVVRVADGRIFGLEADSGRRRWLYEHTVPALTLRGTSNPILVPGRMAVIGLDSGKLVALAPDTGRPLWETTIATPSGRSDLERMVDIDADPVLYRNDIYVASYNGRLAVADAATGRTRWDRELSVHAGLAVARDQVYVTDAEQRVWAFDRFNGASIWRQDELRGLQLTGPAVFGDFILVGDSAGYLNWLSLQDGSLQRRQKIGGAFSCAPVVHADNIYVLTSNGLTVLR